MLSDVTFSSPTVCQKLFAALAPPFHDFWRLPSSTLMKIRLSAPSKPPKSSSSSNVNWISTSKEVAKHVIAVGECLPLPYVKGLGLAVLVFLEGIEVRIVLYHGIGLYLMCNGDLESTGQSIRSSSACLTHHRHHPNCAGCDGGGRGKVRAEI